MYGVLQRGTNLLMVVFVLILVLSAMLSSVTAQAQYGDHQGVSNMISLDVVDADLSKVVLMLARDSKQSIVVADQEKMHSKVTATLKDMPLETALRYIVESVGCTFYRAPDGVYVIGGRSQTGFQENTSVPLVDSLASSSSRSYEARRVTKVDTIKLYNMSPVDIMWTLGLYEVRDYEKIEKAQFKPGVYMQKSDGGLDVLVSPEQMTPPLTESLKYNSSIAQRFPELGNEAAQFPSATPGYGSNQRQTVPGGTTGRQPGQTGAVSGGSGTGSGLLPEGIDQIIPYEMDNSLIVRGDQEGIEELKAIISKLDIAPKQIMVKAEFVSISTSDIAALGINWNLERMNTTFSTNFPLKGDVLIGYASGNLMTNLQTQLQQTKGKLINAPLITTLNNVPASISFSTQVPYLSSQTVFNPQGTPTSVSVTQFMNVNSALRVLPRINNADNSITVSIWPQLSDIEKFVPTGNGDVPIVNTQYLETTRRVGNGETIVLGGLIRKNDTQSINKIPLLGDLPLIGPLFRNTDRNNDDKELLIFLTPSIVPEKPIAGTGIGVIP